MPSVICDTSLGFASLNILTKKRYDILRAMYGSLEAAWGSLDETLLKKLRCKEQTIRSALAQIRSFDYERESAALRRLSIQLISIEDQAYPTLLREIADPPVFLFAKGNLELLNEPSIAIVGARRMSPYGKRVVSHLVPELANAGLITVSGLAIGIDAEVARETIRCGGRTIAILGHGLGSVYPKSNTDLAESIIEHEGLLLSEYPLGIQPDTFTFPSRNRIIAGISLGTIVAEAAQQSGSLITASLALEDGREVFAVPGQIFDPHFTGTHHLIARGGAKLITSASDILSELGIATIEGKKASSSYRPQTSEEKVLLTALSPLPQTTDDLSEKSGLDIGLLNATLTLMELKGGAKNIGMGQWIRG